MGGTSTVGVGRTRLTPFWGVELTGWGYYIGRAWRRVHDDLNATAVAFDDGERQAVLVALDLMVIDAKFATRTRERIREATGLDGSCVMLSCSHTHNAPAAGGLLGVGECDPAYEDWASRQAATAAILAWENRQPATVKAGHVDVPGLSYNRTRENGLTDDRLTVLGVDRADGSPLAVVVNFGAHPCVSTLLRPFDVSRDVPGLICDGLEKALPGATALYVQGACGDVNFLAEFTDLAREKEPAEKLVEASLEALGGASRMEGTVGASSVLAEIPTRRWEREEVMGDRREAERRMKEDDIRDWRQTIGRSMTNRPDDMVRRHGGDERKAVRAMCRFHLEWTDLMLRDLETRPEVLETEVQALRIGDLAIVSNASEFFTPFALDLRKRAGDLELMVSAYTNARIGYLPDEHDIAIKSYAGYQSPKYCDQFPFTEESGPAMVAAMAGALRAAGGVV